MNKNVLITGVTGFAGSHLAEYYLNTEPETMVYGIHRTRSPLGNIQDAMRFKNFRLIKADITEHESMLALMETIRFDVIHHLAAQSFVPDSWQLGTKTFNVNVNGTYNILACVAKLYSDEFPVVHLAGSSEEYGLVYPDETPITESNPLRPLSPYAVSKIATENLGYQMSKSYGIPVVVSRAFNHSGKRRGEAFICSNFAKQVVDQLGHDQISLSVGNLDAIRDFTDVRDTVRAYYLLTTYMKDSCVDDYFMCNIATGVGYTGWDIVQKLSRIVGEDILTEKDLKRMRPSDVPILIGSYDRLHGCTGWEPKYTLDDILESLVEYWKDYG